MLDEDLSGFLEDHGVPCSVGAVEFLGIKDSPDEEIPSGAITAQSTMATLRMLTSDVVRASIKAGTVLTVNGSQYKARNPMREDDGAFSLVPLSKVTP